MASDRQKQGGPSRPDRRSSEGSKGGRTVWDSPEISSEVVEELILRFPTVVRLPEERVRAVSEDWGSKSLVAMPLGRRVSAEVAARELRLRGDLKGDVTGLPMDEKIILLRFTEEEDRKRILHRPWIISGQILAVEPWRPCFFPTSSSIRSAVVWIRLPALPVEFWEEDLLRQITEGAGEMEYLDECTIHRRRLGFARVAVRISLAQPLRPGVLIEGLGGRFWQRFVYEQAAGVCFACGRFHGEEGRCTASVAGSPEALRPENVVGEGAGEGAADASRPALGPWIAAVRRWLPPEKKAAVPEQNPSVTSEVPRSMGKEKGKAPAVFGDGCAGLSSEPEGWIKPAKIARRRSPARSLGGGAGSFGASDSGVANSFVPLSGEGVGEEPSVADGPVKEPGHSKRARSPVGLRRGPGGGKQGKPSMGKKDQEVRGPAKEFPKNLSEPTSKGSGSLTGDDQGTFVFTAVSSRLAGLPPESAVQVPTMGVGPRNVSHEEAAGRISKIIQGDGEGLGDLMDPLEVDSGDCQGVSSGAVPSSSHLDQ